MVNNTYKKSIGIKIIMIIMIKIECRQNKHHTNKNMWVSIYNINMPIYIWRHFKTNNTCIYEEEDISDSYHVKNVKLGAKLLHYGDAK
jgi:hypothetical protein